MTNDCIAQAWYRFLHSLGNPVELSRPAVVSQTQHFYQYAIVAENVIDPTHHPCLSALPNIFLKAMKGIAAMVDAYLGKIMFGHRSMMVIIAPITNDTEIWIRLLPLLTLTTSVIYTCHGRFLEPNQLRTTPLQWISLSLTLHSSFSFPLSPL